MCCWHPFVSRVCWLVAGGALHWHGHLWILDIDASGVRWKTFIIKTFIKTAHKQMQDNSVLLHDSHQDTLG